MEEFTENFEKFKDFLNSKATEKMIQASLGENAKIALNIIKERFDELGLNNSF